MNTTSLRALLLLTKAWTMTIVRDRGTLFWLFAFPILFVVIFGLAFGGSDVGSYEVGVAVDESTPGGQALVEALRSIDPFEVSTGALDAELNHLRDGDRYVVVATEPGAAAATAAGASTTVVVYYDPSRNAAQQIVLPIVRQVVDSVDRDLSGRPTLLPVEERSVAAESLRFIDFFLPGIIAFSIMQAGMFAAIPLVQLRVARMLKRFGATPAPRWVVLASQTIVRLAMALIQTAVLLLMAILLFDLHTDANWPAAAGFTLLGGLVFLAIGFAISGLARTEDSVPAIVQAFSFPMMFLGGVFWPIETFPDFLQPVARAMPLTFLGDALRQTMVGGSPLNSLTVDAAALLAFLALSGVLAVRLFKWE